MRHWLAALPALAAVVIIGVVLVLRYGSDPAASVPVPASAPTSGPAPTAVRPETYVSPSFGYTITYDAAWWIPSGTQFDITTDGVPRHIDQILFDHPTLTDQVNVLAERGFYEEKADMSACADQVVAGYTDLDQFAPVTDPVTGAGDGRAWMQYDYDDTSTGVRTTLYVECQWLGDHVTLTIHHTADAAEFAQGTTLREQLLAGLDTTNLGVATPVPTQDAADDDLATYESARFGYTLTYDAALWDASTSQGSATMSGYEVLQDSLQLTNQKGTVTIDVVGEYGWFGTSASMPSCAENALLAFTIWDDLKPLASPVPGGGDGLAWVQAAYEIEGVPTTVYTECRWIGGDVTLKVEQTAPTDEFPQWVQEREDLLAGLDTSGLIPSEATPAASPVSSASPVVAGAN